ncbi:MAG: zf-TFIIB domain-containing protein [bacterium]|nr:zf-TFIIB domain-containing protein [bacterium]
MWDNIIKKIRPGRPRPESADIHRPHSVDSQEQGARVDVHSDEAAKREAAEAFAALRSVGEEGGARAAAPRRNQPARKLDCPACGAAMALERIGRVEVDRCPKCRGIFLDRGELEQLSGKKHSSYVVSDPAAGNDDPDFLIYTPHGLSDHVRDA